MIFTWCSSSLQGFAGEQGENAEEESFDAETEEEDEGEGLTATGETEGMSNLGGGTSMSKLIDFNSSPFYLKLTRFV